jgi:hypothetical protein
LLALPISSSVKRTDTPPVSQRSAPDLKIPLSLSMAYYYLGNYASY